MSDSLSIVPAAPLPASSGVAAPIKISVITVCYNAAATIEATLRSVCGQEDALFEYIVVDGASTDSTMAIVDRYRERITTVVSEKDAGIFDAMNKGIGLSSGDVIYFLGADDTFVDSHVLRDIAAVFREDDGRLLVYGNVVFTGAPPGVVYGPARPFVHWSVKEFLNNSFCHQALFARRSLFDDVGVFNDRLRYSADYEWVIKVFKFAPRSFFHVDRFIANYFYCGRSQTQAATTRREVRSFYFRHFRSFDLYWFYLRYIFLRGLKKQLLREPW